MITRFSSTTLRATVPAAVLAVLAIALVGCDPAPPAEAPQEVPAPGSDAPADATPAPTTSPSETPPPEAPPSTEPSAASEPPLESMQTAKAPAKLSVPVDLKYSFDTQPLANQPVTLHLAVLPRAPVSNLAVSIKAVDGIQVASGSQLNVQKAEANAAYRQQFSITRQTAAPAELRVLVTVDFPEGSGHGFFTIPLASGISAQKQDSVKQR